MTIIPARYQKLQLLNPMAQAIQDARFAVVTHDPKVITVARVFNNGPYMLIPFVIVIVVFFIGLAYFRSRSQSFAEDI